VKPSVEQLESLLALKRHERPEEGYWQDFLCEFHHRQREQAAMKSGLAGWFSRFSTWLSDVGPSKWAYGAGLAYASVAAVALLMPKGVDYENTAPQPVRYEVQLHTNPAPGAEQLEQLDLSPSTQGTAGEQVF
jgi:hypothetical protein